MSQRFENAYEFDDSLPLNPVPAGSTLLVAGPAFGHTEAIAQSLVTEGTTVDEGAIYITTNDTCKKLLQDCRRTYPELNTGLIGTIDCTGQNIGQEDLGIDVKYVSTQSDLTGIGMKYSALYESLYGRSQDGRVRTGLFSLTSLLMYTDLRPLFQFTQTMSNRIDSADGLGVFTIDPTTQESQTLNTLNQVADGRIEIRGGEDVPDAHGELRIRGLPEQPSGWQPFDI